MAGKALKRKILKEVADRGGSDYIYEIMASGKTITAWASEDFGCSRSYLSRALRENPEYARAMDRALPEAADALMEDGLSKVDALGEASTQQQIAAVREQINMRKALAAGWNRDRYGSGPKTEITLNLGDLHLDALRKISTERKNIEVEDMARNMKVIEHE